jgi:cell division protein FtsL
MLFVSVNVIALATRMKQVNDRREKLASRMEERKEKEEKWKHGHKQEKVKKPNPKDVLKRKVEYIATCEGNVHFIATCINICIVRQVQNFCPKQSEQCIVVTFFIFTEVTVIQKLLDSW